MRATIVGVLGLIVWIAGSADARACDCASNQGACVEVPRTQAVFVGRVVGRAQGDVLFDVERAVRGVEKGRIRIDSGEGNCMFSFKDGERYIVYAYWDSRLKMLSTSICSRTVLASDPHARADLAYFDRAAAGMISGVIYDTTAPDTPTPFSGRRPLANAIVSVSGRDRGTHTASTGADGSYMFKELPSGTWRLTVKTPPGFVLLKPLMVTIPEKEQCTEADFYTHRVAAGAPR